MTDTGRTAPDTTLTVGCPLHGGYVNDCAVCARLLSEAIEAIRAQQASADRWREALEAIVRHADMPDGESWERAYVEITQIARDALEGDHA